VKTYYQQTGNLPSIAGLAKLKYEDVKTPKREGDVITLPETGWGLYQLAPDFSQFLVLKDITDEHTTHRKSWFGGTDEQPFLVELKSSPTVGKAGRDITQDWLDVWKNGTVEECLKPTLIRKFEKAYGSEKTKRQGDMFCYPMPEQDWEKLLCLINASNNGEWNWGPQKTYYPNGTPLYDTRHILFGKYAHYATGKSVIGKGTIKAPDHNDLVLEEIHVIIQTANLNKPKEAD